MADFTAWVAPWESRFADLVKVNHRAEKRHIVVPCLDAATKTVVDNEVAKGKLLTWEQSRDYLTAIGTNRGASEATFKGPAPMIMHAPGGSCDDDTAKSITYTDEEWN